MKSISMIICCIVCLSGCATDKNKQDSRINPGFEHEKFEDYKPWWSFHPQGDS